MMLQMYLVYLKILMNLILRIDHRFLLYLKFHLILKFHLRHFHPLFLLLLMFHLNRLNLKYLIIYFDHLFQLLLMNLKFLMNLKCH